MMFRHVLNTLQAQQQFVYQHDGITLCPVTDVSRGIFLASLLLQELCDKKTVVYLSGGRTPQDLYSHLTKEEHFAPGAVAMVDERFGKKFHERSNEKMMQETGLLRYLQLKNIPFYPILSLEESRETTAEHYDERLRSLQALFQHHVGILGIGADGHTAGIPMLNANIKSKKSKIYQTVDFAVEYDDHDGFYKERVTMTFHALSMLDVLVVLIFGEDKKKALKNVFQEGSEEEIPARFYKRPAIAKKTLFITDQNL